MKRGIGAIRCSEILMKKGIGVIRCSENLMSMVIGADLVRLECWFS